MNEVRRNAGMARILIAILSVALVFTMMPLSMGKAFAEEEPATAVFSVTGQDLLAQLSYDSIKTLKNDEAIKPLIKEDVVFHTKNSSGTEEDLTVTGVTIEDLIKLAGLKENMELESVTATADDGYAKTYTADQILKEDLQGNKAMFIWSENGNKVQKTAVGQFTTEDQNKGLWVKGNTITLTVTAKAKVLPVFSVMGADLVTQLEYDSIKTMKNDEAIKPLILKDVVFHTKNKAGTEEDFTVTGVTIESLLGLAGIKEGMELEAVTATADDGFSKTYTADQILTEDLQGNKAMFIWDENGAKVQKTAIGQFTPEDQNRGLWVGGNTITLNIICKALPKKNTLSVKSANKTYRVKTLKKKAQTYKALTVKSPRGTVSYNVKYANGKAKKALKLVTKTGKLTVKKGTKKGTYKVTVTVKAAGTDEYLPKSVKKTITVKVK